MGVSIWSTTGKLPGWRNIWDVQLTILHLRVCSPVWVCGEYALVMILNEDETALQSFCRFLPVIQALVLLDVSFENRINNLLMF